MYALGVGRDTREVGTVEDGALQGPCFEQCFFRPLARGVVGANQEVADDGICRVAQRGDRDHGREAAAILADVGQLVDVFDADASALNTRASKAWRNRRVEFDAERSWHVAMTSAGSEISAA